MPAELAARVRLLDSGQHPARPMPMTPLYRDGRRADQGPARVAGDGELEALRLLVERREALTRRRVQIVDRLQALLAELLPGQAKKDITTGQAKGLLAWSVRATSPGRPGDGSRPRSWAS